MVLQCNINRNIDLNRDFVGIAWGPEKNFVRRIIKHKIEIVYHKI